MYLTFVTFLPLLACFVLAMIPREKVESVKWFALIVAGVDFILSLPLYFEFNMNSADMQFEYITSWIPQWGISYHVGMDGISLLLYIMTTFLTFISILASWEVKKHVKEYMMAMLALSTGMLGVFIALDFFLFYVFWEFQLIPMYIIIGVWGGPRRIYAAVKFFIYTAVGSLLMLVGIIWMYFHFHSTVGVFTTDILLITEHINLTLDQQKWLFMAFFLAFAIKVPMFPFHTWLPDAHVEAPTAGSVILAGVLLKMGTYGFLRFNLPMFPVASNEFLPFIAGLAIIGIIYGALVAMVQEDLKKLVAYSSVSHLGFVMLGIFAFNHYGLQGALLQNLNHGISTSALFLMVGMIYDRRHTRLISEFGGIAKVIPVFTICFMIATLSSIGLPGTNGFVGEFLILLGIFQVNGFYAGLATTGVIFAACYMLWMFQRVMFLKIEKPENEKLTDMTGRELGVMVPLIVLIFWIGFYPTPFTKTFDASIDKLVKQVDPAQFMPHAQDQHAAKTDLRLMRLKLEQNGNLN
ncbi:NADH-quinone oxidoreductase subunit M [Nitrospina watsonii]|uniref:NADH-quinone oxidoreductase, subunit M n=1 Tax=Nitrospina watsonii TaxID=1323948 RepID=A0ABM9HEN6_9BACT|nr:NADH-quinone oxidoreductase subunit M [Nitrospina watsonii]CAI2718702.1 NADH-quinone oxidoreductase, subunit M [Nitrospina watsonii]